MGVSHAFELSIVVWMKSNFCPPWGFQIMEPFKYLYHLVLVQTFQYTSTNLVLILVHILYTILIAYKKVALSQPVLSTQSHSILVIENSIESSFDSFWMIMLKTQSKMGFQVCSKSRRRFYILHPRPQAGNGNMGNLLMIWHPCTENLHIVVLYCE